MISEVPDRNIECTDKVSAKALLEINPPPLFECKSLIQMSMDTGNLQRHCEVESSAMKSM